MSTEPLFYSVPAQWRLVGHYNRSSLLTYLLTIIHTHSKLHLHNILCVFYGEMYLPVLFQQGTKMLMVLIATSLVDSRTLPDGPAPPDSKGSLHRSREGSKKGERR